MPRYYYRRGKRRERIGLPIKFCMMVFCLLALTAASLMTLDRKIMPAAMAISHMQAKSKANQVIDSTLQEILKKGDITSDALYLENTKGISANTMLINSFCNTLSMGISKRLLELKEEEIRIPMGAVSGVTIFSNMGPDISFTMQPMGDTTVDYETAFESVGINQTNYKVWIHIKINVQLINPLSYELVTMERKVMLLDTVITGDVPREYLDLKQR